MKPRLLLLAAFALAASTAEAQASTILISNDDGLTSNVRALYLALKEAGHDVIVAVPCTNQSGMGAALRFSGTPARLEADCRSGAARAGDPAAGPITRAGFENDWYYVSGTPVMALMFGLDVAAKQRWGHDPDLVISGPNEGQNAGPVVISSGTVSNAQFAALKGIPAVAVSAGLGTADDAGLANPASPVIARYTAALVGALVAAGPAPLLPRGIALNVNFPDRLESLKWKPSRIGSYSAFSGSFAPGSGDKPPRLVFGLNPVAPTKAQQLDEAVVSRGAISVSVMQAGYEGPASDRRVRRMLKALD